MTTIIDTYSPTSRIDDIDTVLEADPFLDLEPGTGWLSPHVELIDLLGQMDPCDPRWEALEPLVDELIETAASTPECPRWLTASRAPEPLVVRLRTLARVMQWLPTAA